MIDTRLSQRVFNPYATLQRIQAQIKEEPVLVGASSLFIGSMRSLAAKGPIRFMDIEHYPKMTHKALADLANQVSKRYQLHHCLIVHRIGRIFPGQTIVLIATWHKHRGHAIEACSDLIEKLKTDIPLWKKEHFNKGAQWVSSGSVYP